MIRHRETLTPFPQTLLILGTDLAGKDHCANVLVSSTGLRTSECPGLRTGPCGPSSRQPARAPWFSTSIMPSERIEHLLVWIGAAYLKAEHIENNNLSAAELLEALCMLPRGAPL